MALQTLKPDFFPLYHHLSYYTLLSLILYFIKNYSSSSQVVLSSSSDWLQWFQLIKTAAVNTDIWDDVNPNVKKDIIPICTEPEEPTYRTVNRAATTFRDLEPLEREELRDLRSSFKRKYTVYREQKIASFKFG